MLSGKVYKIKEGKLDVWKAWCLELQTSLAKEAIETLVEEGVFAEGFLIFQIDKDFYTLGFCESESSPKAANNERDINKKHREIKHECLEPAGEIEGGYFLHEKAAL